MNKTELLNKFAKDSDERVALAKALDRMDQTARRAIPSATRFLSPAERAALDPLLAALDQPKHLYNGGYEGAERTVCVFLPDWLEPEDWDPAGELSAVEALFPPGAGLTHRDLLGGLMGVGLVRERVGDILIKEDRAQIVALADAAPIILSQFERAGRHTLRLRPLELGELAPAPAAVKVIHDTVAAPRLDAVLAAGFSLSRSRAAQLVSAGRVSLNHRECLKGDRPVAPGDTITCRGLGKCVLKSLGGLSRKGRAIVEIERYL